jgi:arginine decarboxylase
MTGVTGRGPTQLPAVDTAPMSAGIADHNLIYLSPVLPPASTADRVDLTIRLINRS